MTISRGQMNRQLYMGGGIMNAVPREQYGFGSIFKGVKNVVKKVAGGIKDIASSDVGKAALLAAGGYYLGGGSLLGAQRAGMSGFSFANLPGAGMVPDSFNPIKMFGKKKIKDFLTSGTGIATVGGGLASLFAGLSAADQADIDAADVDERGDVVAEKLRQSLTRLGFSGKELEDKVAKGVSEYTGYTSKAEGGRIGFDMGSPRAGLGSLLSDIGQDPGVSEEIQFSDYSKDMSSQSDFVMPKGSDARDDLREVMLFKDNDMAKAEQLIDEQGIDKLYEEAVEIVRNNDEANEYFLSLVNNKDLNISAADAYYSVIKKFGNNMAEGGRIGYQDAGPVLPNDPTQPVNPFGPRPPADAPVLPDRRMASNMENDKILEALFEKFLDMGLSPEKAAKEAKKEFKRMSMMQTEGRGLAAMGGRMNYALGGGDTASQNAMQAASIEGLPIRQNPKGIQELDLRDSGGFIPPVGIKEKADDIPAMLSDNEFVYTADAVRGMGDGDVELGAQRMYDQMKMLEEGGRV